MHLLSPDIKVCFNLLCEAVLSEFRLKMSIALDLSACDGLSFLRRMH